MLPIMAVMLLLTALAMADVRDRVERRATEAAVWGMSIVNFQATRNGTKYDRGVGYIDVAYNSNSKVQAWRLRTTVS